MNKQDQVINRLATNFGGKIGQLEGEKAILQIELETIIEENKKLKQSLEEFNKETEVDQDVKNQ